MANNDPSKPAQSGEVSDRRADALAGVSSFSEALKKSRKAKERGDLRRAREIMRAWKNRD